jgi:folylpolyglutamate synthase/dihydropteroate synthase
VEEAIAKAKQGIGKLKGMCVCGSLYLAGDARKILLSDAKN